MICRFIPGKFRRIFPVAVLAAVALLLPRLAAGMYETRASIDKHRKGELIILAKPGEKIMIEQLSHEFWFGCALSNRMFDGSAPEADAAQYREKFLENFNSAVTENALKWGTMERIRGQVDYSVLDNMLGWTDRNGLPLRGHNLFWGIPQFIQPWVKEMDDQELEKTLRERAETVTARFKGRFAEYDLNNEMVHGNYYEERLGRDITLNMSKWALTGDPGAKLWLNDYDILTGRRLDDYMKQIRTFLKQGVPVAGIGVQGHLHGETFDRHELKRALDSLAQFSLPIRVTEFNIPGQRSKYYKDRNLVMTPEEEALKATELVDYYRICFAHPAVEGILMWGFWEGANWIPVSSLYRRDWSPTPAARAYRDLVFGEWWTRTEGVAGSDGSLSVKGFYGKYRITIGGTSRVVDLTREEKRCEVDFHSRVKIIFDTDMHTDCDDAGAMAVLHALADRGECEILGMMLSTKDPHAAATIDAINTWYGHPDIPIGVIKGEGVYRHSKFTKGIAAEFPHDVVYETAPDATMLYRDILEKQPDSSVVIVTVGYLTNISNLMRLPAENGRLSGLDLIRRKVRKWVCMGGNFMGDPPRDDLKLPNVNFQFDAAAAHYAIHNWPGELIFAGREVCSVPSGLEIGESLVKTPADNPVRRAYELYFGGTLKNRHVADLASVLYAVRGLRDYWDIQTYGYMDLQPDMTFEWKRDRDKNQSFLLKKMRDGVLNDRYVESVLDALMIQPPVR